MIQEHLQNDPYPLWVELIYYVDNSDYKSEMVANLSDTWFLVHSHSAGTDSAVAVISRAKKKLEDSNVKERAFYGPDQTCSHKC